MRYRGMWCSAVALSVLLPQCATAQAPGCGPTRYDCAVFYVVHHDLAAAIRTLNEELSQSPQNLKGLNLLGIALTESGRTEQANSRFKAALVIDPHFYPARKNLAINEFGLKHFPEAAAQFNRVLKDAPNDEVVRLYLGEINFQRNDFAAALNSYQKGVGRIAQNPRWVLHYAQCLIAQSDSASAITALRLLPKDDAEDRFQAGMLLGGSGAYPEAADLFGSARKTYSDPYVAGYNQLLMLTNAASYAAAIQLFNELVAQGYGRAELYNLVSDAFLKSGRVQEAYDALRTATQLEPEAEDNYVDLAALCLDYEKYDAGLEILDVGIHYVSNSYRLYVQRGFMLVMRGRMDEAEKEFQIAATLAPDKSLPYIALGEVWMQKGQAQKAADMLREKSKLPRADFLIPYIFAEALIRSGADVGTPAAAEAIQALETSVRLNSNFSHSHAELGKLLFKQGDIDRAIAELKAGAALDPNDSGPVYVLAQAYRKKGQKAEAEAMLARVAQLHSPDHELDINKELKRLVKQDTVPSQVRAKP